MAENSTDRSIHCSVKEESCDSLFDGKIVCWQHVDGYRFSVDSVLLPHFVSVRNNDIILDLGTGCGIIGLILLHRYIHNNISIIGIEKQAGLFGLAKRNISENRMTKSFSLFQSDINDIARIILPESCDLVVSNPPYYAPRSGRTSRDAEAAIARHLDYNGLETFVQAASFGVKNRGRVAFIYPTDLMSELLAQCKAYRLEPKSLQMIYSYPKQSRDAKLVFLETIKNGGVGLSVRSPFYIYQDSTNTYSDDMQAMYLSENKRPV